MELSLIQKIIIFALPVIFAITLHEAAHGYVAKYFGDTTAYQAGRISLNPIRHIDPVGTLLVPGVILLMSSLFGGGFILFGWAKPVPVNFGRLRHPKKDMLWVALAGPAANLFMALFWAVMIRLAPALPGNLAEPLFLMGVAGIFINAVLIALNLIPLPPLDGGRIAVSLLPQPYAYKYSRIEPYGMMILILLMFTHVLGLIMWPLMSLTIGAVVSLLGIPFDKYMALLGILFN